MPGFSAPPNPSSKPVVDVNLESTPFMNADAWLLRPPFRTDKAQLRWHDRRDEGLIREVADLVHVNFAQSGCGAACRTWAAYRTGRLSTSCWILRAPRAPLARPLTVQRLQGAPGADEAPSGTVISRAPLEAANSHVAGELETDDATAAQPETTQARSELWRVRRVAASSPQHCLPCFAAAATGSRSLHRRRQ